MAVLYRALADVLLVVHLLFILFVVFGGVLALRWPRAAWLHLPLAAWGAYTALAGVICPLTPWENALRRAAGAEGYAGGFIEHYLMPVVYPPEMSRPVHIGLGAAALLWNLAVYAWVIRRRRRRKPGASS